MEYSIVIATRNRAKALALSIPRMLAQTRDASQIIIIDSSDDHSEIERVVADSTRTSRAQIILRASERGISKQRNLGLELVSSPIVFFPDDDSIWYPDTAEETMKVYEQDSANKISAVCAHEAKPPEDFGPASSASSSYSMKSSDRFRQKLTLLRLKLERKLIQNPLQIIGREFISRYAPAIWEARAGVSPVEWMTGFRMSFRTEAIKKSGFEKSFTNYSLGEDIEASFSAWKQGAVVGASKAHVFHFKSPERRGSGWELGFQHLLNLSFIAAKHSPVSHPARKAIPGFARYKIFLYFLGARGMFGRERLKGALHALPHINKLVLASSDELEHIYLTAQAEVQRFRQR